MDDEVERDDVQSRPPRKATAMTTFAITDLGRNPYEPTLRLQERLVREVQAGTDAGAHLLLVEHDPPVITFGRRGNEAHVLASPEALATKGIETHHVSRGGDVTYHGPGQLVGYPIFSLRRAKMKASRYVHDLEEMLIQTLWRLGVAGRRVEGVKGATGVWVDDEKVAAIGVAVEQGVCYHGFALNVCPDLSHFGLIIPCGLAGSPVTSISKLLGRTVGVSEIKTPLLQSFAEVFDAQLHPVPWAQSQE